MEEREGGAIPLRVIHKRHSFHSLSSVCSRNVPAPPHPSLPQLLLFIAQQARIFVGEIDLPGMDAAQWHQELGPVKTMEEMIMAGNPNPNPNPNPNAIPNPPPAPPAGAEAQRTPGPPAVAGKGSTKRRARPQKEKAINCPRCNSTNTKFCYYNNYSLQQPRYFCKTCHRYWTDGGSLRNVPVGSGLRKNKRSSPSFVVSSAAASTSAAPPGAVPACGMAAKNPKSMQEGANDLDLALPHHLHHGRVLHPSEFAAFPSLESSSVCNPGGAMAANGTGGGRSIGAFSAMELLRSTGCYVPLQLGMLLEYAAAGFMPLPQQQHHQQQQQVRNLLGFSLDTGGGGDAGGYGACSAGLQGAQENATARLLFPLEDLKPGVNAAGGGANGGGGDQFEHIKDQGGGNNSMIGNGSRNGAGVGGGSW